MSDSKALVSMVPEFYFDLISRVPAGMSLILIVLAYIPPESSPLREWLVKHALDGTTSILILVMLLVASYSVSVPLTVFGALIHKSHRGVVCKHAKVIFKPEVSNLENRYGCLLTDYKFLRLLTDELKSKSSHASFILPKMNAEVSLCNNLAAALMISLFLSTAFSEVSSDAISFIIIVAIFSILGAAHRFYRLLVRQISYAKIQGVTD